MVYDDLRRIPFIINHTKRIISSFRKNGRKFQFHNHVLFILHNISKLQTKNQQEIERLPGIK